MSRSGGPTATALGWLAGLCLVPAAAWAGDVSPVTELVLPRLSGAIRVDGDPSEAAWDGAVALERFYEIVPGENVEPAVGTVGLLAYDSEFLYVGVRCQDPDPSRIRAPYVERDHVADQDLVQIDVDARDEGRWSQIFRVNPHGVQTDGVFDEATGLDDFSPDFHFESAARIGPDGWTAEMRIPLSTLRYQARDPQTWRITFFRLYPRRFRYQLTSNPIPRGSNCWLCHSVRFTEIAGLPRGGSVTLTPFVTGGASRGPGDETLEGQRALGGDVKWLPRPNLAVDLALNPDFSQVESDVPQIGVNSRFALFYPEKRPFFLEGTDLWTSPIPVVHTRTITDPDWGGRVTGRPGNSSFTLLAARDQGGGSLVLPGPESSSVAPQPEDAVVFLGRYRYGFGRSSLGTLASLREGGQGYFNRIGGLDFQWYPAADDHVSGQLLYSDTRDAGAASASGHAVLLAWERSLRQLRWAAQLEELSREFRADNGFVPQTGVRKANAAAAYSFYPRGPIRTLEPQVAYEQVRQTGGDLVSEALSLGLAADGRVQASVEWHPREKARALDGRLFEATYWTASARFLPNRRLPYLKLSARHGDELDIQRSRLGTGTALAVSATISAVDRLQAELSGERRWLDADEEGHSVRQFAASVARAKLLCTLTARSFVRLIGEWERSDEHGGSASQRAFSGSVLYGYRLNWQSILYLGYGNSPGDPASGPGRQQEWFVKLAYAFRP
jgi:Domain of unknown function (DUF5916)